MSFLRRSAASHMGDEEGHVSDDELKTAEESGCCRCTPCRSAPSREATERQLWKAEHDKRAAEVNRLLVRPLRQVGSLSRGAQLRVHTANALIPTHCDSFAVEHTANSFR